MKIEVKCKLIIKKITAINQFYIVSDTPKCKHKKDIILVMKRGQQAVLSSDMDAVGH